MLQHAFPVPFKAALHKGQEKVRDDDCMDLYTAFLLSNFRVPADTPENQVGEQRHRCGIDDFEPSQPSGQPVEAGSSSEEPAIFIFGYIFYRTLITIIKLDWYDKG
nr:MULTISPECIES: hypothetical protein [unclassified Fibrobacter]